MQLTFFNCSFLQFDMGICVANGLIGFEFGKIVCKMLCNLCNANYLCSNKCLKESRILDIVETRKFPS